MKKLLAAALHGRELRHLAVALDAEGLAGVRALLVRASGEAVPARHVPAALHPLTLAVDGERDGVDDATHLLLLDARASEEPGRAAPSAVVTLRRDRVIEAAGGRTVLYRPTAAVNRFEPVSRRWWTYLLARRHARRTQAVAHRLGMTALELMALDCYYASPRPVHLVSVRHGARSNLFPMDLVGPFGGGDRFTLALRNTSASVETIRASRRVVLSVVPAAWKEAAYALGAHHRKEWIDPAALPFPLASSRAFGLPVPAAAPGYREVEILGATEVGSHTFFDGRTVNHEEPPRDVLRLAHVSALYAAWRARRGAPLAAA